MKTKLESATGLPSHKTKVCLFYSSTQRVTEGKWQKSCDPWEKVFAL